MGLTVAYAVGHFWPVDGGVRNGLKTMDTIISKVLSDSLPIGTGWLDHLDILNAVRINRVIKLKKFDDFYAHMMSGYIDVGIQIDSESHKNAIRILESVSLSENILVMHELREGYIRLNIVRRDQIDRLKFVGKMNLNRNGMIENLPIDVQLSEGYKKALFDIYDMYEDNQTKRNENIIKFGQILDEYETFKVVKSWWDNINSGFDITSVGKVLAQANAKRCDPSLPDLM